MSYNTHTDRPYRNVLSEKAFHHPFRAPIEATLRQPLCESERGGQIVRGSLNCPLSPLSASTLPMQLPARSIGHPLMGPLLTQ